jgi:hypothetical protein
MSEGRTPARNLPHEGRKMTLGFAVQPFLTRSGINSPFLIAAFLVGAHGYARVQ